MSSPEPARLGLGQRRQRMRDAAHWHEKAHAQILGAHMGGEVVQQGLVLRLDRPQPHDGAVAQPPLAFERRLGALAFERSAG